MATEVERVQRGVVRESSQERRLHYCYASVVFELCVRSTAACSPVAGVSVCGLLQRAAASKQLSRALRRAWTGPR